MAYVQLTSEERYLIEHLAQHHISHREIARRLKRHHTTVSRELARNDPVLADASTGIEARTRKPCSAAPCRTTSGVTTMRRWCGMSSTACATTALPTSSPRGSK